MKTKCNLELCLILKNCHGFLALILCLLHSDRICNQLFYHVCFLLQLILPILRNPYIDLDLVLLFCSNYLIAYKRSTTIYKLLAYSLVSVSCTDYCLLIADTWYQYAYSIGFASCQLLTGQHFELLAALADICTKCFYSSVIARSAKWWNTILCFTYNYEFVTTDLWWRLNLNVLMITVMMGHL